MKPDPDHEQLLADVFSEDIPGHRREALLAETLYLAGRRRRFRRIKRGAAVVLVTLGLVLVTLWRNEPARQVPDAVKATGFVTIRTQPMARAQIIVTRPTPAEMMVTSIASVRVVRTNDVAEGPRLLNDQELLALVDARPAVLVHRGPGDAELIFANPKDQAGFPLN